MDFTLTAPVYWLLKALYNICHICTLMAQAAMQGAHQEQFGVQYFAQGHFDIQLGGTGIRTSDLPITRPPALPPELQKK